MSDDVIAIEPPGRELHFLDQVADSEPGSLWHYDHTGKKTLFSRWIAINRKRKSIRIRHTTRNINRVARRLDEITASPGIVAFDNGSNKNYLTFFRVENKRAEPLEFSAVPALPSGQHFLWI